MRSLLVLPSMALVVKSHTMVGRTADWRDVCFSITVSASVGQLVTILT